MADKKVAKPKTKALPAKKSVKPVAPRVPRGKKARPAPVTVDKLAHSKNKVSRSPDARSGCYAELLKKKAELEALAKEAKAELRKQIDDKLKEADDLKKQYAELFNEPYSETPEKGSRKRAARVLSSKPRTRRRGFSIAQVESFISQKETTHDIKDIKIEGKNITGVKKINAAYEKADPKNAKTILELLK